MRNTDNNVRKYQYWQYLNHLPLSAYLRAQRLNIKFFGGWIRGINISDSKVSFIIE